MNEKFVTMFGELAEGDGIDSELGEGLPAIGYDEVIVAAPPATQVQHEPRLANRLAKLFESGLVKFAITKQPRGDDDVRRPGVDPLSGVVRRDAAADL